MADSLPNARLAQQQTLLQIAEQTTAIHKARLGVVELADRKQRNLVNIEAAKRAIAELEAAVAAQESRVEAQRLKMQIASQRHTIERQTLENLEGSERAGRFEEQEDAAVKAKMAYELRLHQLDAAHGRFDENCYSGLRQSIEEDPENG